MSQHTLEYLNDQTLIGFTSKRGDAWHYREDLQGDEPNHYTDEVPVDDVIRRLFPWTAVEGKISSSAVLPDGTVLTSAEDDRKAIMRSDNGRILGIFRDGYQMHQYPEWLLKKVVEIMDDGLHIGSAGVLGFGAQAWVSIEMPENIVTPSGFAFRPFLVAATSFDGSLSTTYKRCVQAIICDNTLGIALREKGQTVRVRHSRNSHLKLAEARETLNVIYDIADDFHRQVEALTNITVSEGDWAAFQAQFAPMVNPDGTAKTGRGKTMAANKRAELDKLWTSDARVLPWAGTAFGILQAVNTHQHHVAGVRGTASRGGRNMLRAVRGDVDKLDRSTIELLTAATSGTETGRLLALAAGGIQEAQAA